MMYRNVALWLCCWFLVTCLPSACLAQSERYELGKRLKRFELAWQVAEPEPRKSSTPAMQRAVQSFFGLQLSTAARHLDDAYYASRQAMPSLFERAATAQRLQVQPALLDTQAAVAKLRLRPFYRPAEFTTNDQQAQLLAAAQVGVVLRDHKRMEIADFSFSYSQLRSGLELELANAPTGDHWIEVTIQLESEAVQLPPVQLSMIDRLSERTSALEDWLDGSSALPQPLRSANTLRETVRDTLQTLRSMAEGQPQEIDFPALQRLELVERLAAQPEQAAEILQQQTDGNSWLKLSNGRIHLPVRVAIPQRSETDTAEMVRPILFAFHGAGGSENMFFETYGAGRLVDLATQRGWIVVSPRHPLLGMPFTYRELIDLLKPLLPLDDQRVFLVGHSMGAAEMVRQVSLDSKPARAAVALGGGGRSGANRATVDTPWLVAAGQLDFGRNGARSLAKRLEELDCSVRYSEYSDVEHMVIVQAALDELFDFLDQHAQ